MNSENLKEKTISGLFWQFAQRILGQGISFAISVTLARILLPENYGVVALAGMFTVLLGIFINCGLGTALIQKKDADDIDFSTIFWMQTAFATIIYAIVFILAPFFSGWFKTPELTPVIRVLGLGMILGTYGGIQSVIVSRRMAFKAYFYRTLLGTTSSGIIGIVLAYNGWGVWALVTQHLSAIILNTLTVFAQIRWTPKLIVSKKRFIELFGIGSKFMLSGLIGTGFGQLRGYIIGFKYTTADLAFFNRGEGLPHLFTNNINSSINGVLFPVISKLQDDRNAVKHTIRRSIKTSSFILFPILLGLAAIADNLVVILYTEKWIPCIPFLQLFCISECLNILNTANLQALRGMGYAGTLLKLELYKKPVFLVMLIIAMFISPLAIATANCIYTLYSLIINAGPNKKYINYSIKEQAKDISDGLLFALIMAICVYSLKILKLNPYILISIQIITGAIIYLSLAELFHLESWKYVKENAKPYLRVLRLK